MACQSLRSKAWGPASFFRCTAISSNRVLSLYPRCRRASSSSGQNAEPSSQLGQSQQRRRRRWIQITIITATAAGIGAYAHSFYSRADTPLNPGTFATYELVSRTPVSATSSLFTLRPAQKHPEQGRSWEIYQLAWQRGLWSVQFKQPQLQIGRDYTPLPPLSSNECHEHAWDEVDEVDGTLKFLVRRDPHGGEVSSYLHNLELGATVDIRGPQTEYEIPGDVEELLFIAGGTGIAPALQAAHTLFRSRGRVIHTRMHVLWATRRRDDCLGGRSDLAAPPDPSKGWWGWIKSTFVSKPMSTPAPRDISSKDLPRNITVAELEDLKEQFPGLFTVDYFVDEEDTLIDKNAILKFAGRRGSESNHGGKKLILISGPDGFVGYVAGPKVWEGGRETQGPLQGLIRQLNLQQDWTVWKL